LWAFALGKNKSAICAVGFSFENGLFFRVAANLIIGAIVKRL